MLLRCFSLSSFFSLLFLECIFFSFSSVLLLLLAVVVLLYRRHSAAVFAVKAIVKNDDDDPFFYIINYCLSFIIHMTIVAALPSHDAAVLRHFLSVMLRPSQRGFCLLEISAAKIFSWATATLQRFSRPFLYLIYILCTVWNMPYQTFWVLLHKSTQNLGGWDDENSYFFSVVDFLDNFTAQA